jgi:hypothetical protein
MHPAPLPFAAAITEEYRQNPSYRAARNRMRWAAAINFISGPLNLLFGYLQFTDSSHYLPGDTLYNIEYYGGIASMTIGALLILFGVMILRRASWAAIASVVIGALNILVILYLVTLGGNITSVTGSIIYTILNFRAIVGIRDVVSYERSK